MASDLAGLRKDLQTLLDDSEPLQHAIGQFGKEEAIKTAQRDLGSDRSFSGLKRKVRLGAGYDLGEPVVLNLRPRGLWVLAEKGRRRSGNITPRRRRKGRGGRRTALRTPQGFRATSSYGPTRGHKTIRDTVKGIRRGIVRAAQDGVLRMISQKGY